MYKSWSPHGADRFYRLASEGFFDDQRFFRVIPQYIAQFGASADPKKNDRWDDDKIPDDPRTQSNARGTLSFSPDETPALFAWSFKKEDRSRNVNVPRWSKPIDFGCWMAS